MKKVLYIIALGLLLSSDVFGQITIAEARNQGLGANVTIRGVITNGGELGIIRYIQDPTAAIGIYSFDYSTLMTRGDSVEISGTINEYGNLFEIDPVLDLVPVSTLNPLPAQQNITPGQLGEDLEGELIRLEGVTFNDGGSIFNGNTSYTFSNGLETATIYVRNGSPMIGQNIPAGTITIVGICSQFFSTYQVLARDMDDLIEAPGINLTSQVTVSDINTDGFSLNWTTNLDGTTEVEYGLTPSLELGTFDAGVVSTNHTLALSGLDPGYIYYARVYSVANGDTAFSIIRPYGTESLSSGDITVYFNSSVDTTVSIDENATLLYHAIDDTLIAYINRAEQSLDLTIYDFDNELISNISEAINDAYDRGVIVRFISDGFQAPTNFGVNELIPEIQKIASPTTDDYNIMHNKFVIIDANHEDPMKPIVWTGSTNWTDRQINRDPNDVIIIQDQTLARAYTLEFEEMWGSSGPEADTLTSKFGAYKSDNTPHEFKVHGNRLECYFSPSDGTNNYLLASMESVDFNLYFSTMLITREDLATTLINKHQIGYDVKGVIDDATSTTQYDILIAELAEEDLVVNADTNLIMHHKYMIVDEGNPDNDPIIWTGSHNWSNNANNRNDENTVVVHDPNIVNQYYQEFVARFAQWPTVEPAGIAENAASSQRSAQVFPNPIRQGQNTQLSIPATGQGQVKIYDYQGRVIRSENWNSSANQTLTLKTNDLQSGVYSIVVEIQSGRYTATLVVE
ncbi:MAG: phospholipase D-like domain-containing protein [Flavobacteriales bacterium]